LGLFADGTYGDKLNGVEGTVRGLLYGDASQLYAQLIAVSVNIVFVFVVMFIFFKLSDKIAKIRVPADIEQEGLDMAEVAVIGYPEFSINKTHR
ncbi:MAG: ammonium transporter, partial [Humidesulfovibrio sp.]|nr:ammonium transporter [Humidesulfovibrio sp.]